jgi:hypothetical protein
MTSGAPIRWQKSSFSAQGNNCVEVAPAPDGSVLLRESVEPATVLATNPTRLRALLVLASTRHLAS